jgi:hypothetical protein
MKTSVEIKPGAYLWVVALVILAGLVALTTCGGVR